MCKRILLSGLLPLLLGAQPAQAVDLMWSGFGTVGYAESDQTFNYQRFVNGSGSVKRDSVLGAQLDARFTQEWGATVQARLAPSERYDTRWQPSLTWAFVSWRPSDDWLIRAGKIRLPLMLNTENLDVGATFDLARLPQEVYSIAPTTDVVGLSVSKSWLLDTWEWNLEAYTGKTKTYWRYYIRETQPDRALGDWFVPFKMQSSGLVLTVKDLANTFRIGLHEVEATRVGGQTHSEIPFHQLAPGLGYYDVELGRRVEKLIIPVQTIGASVTLPADVKLLAEYARIKVDSASEGLSRWGAYIALSRSFGAWTPYVYYAKMRSTESALDKYRAIEASARNPLFSTRVNNYQKLASDLVAPYDQWTGAIGTSYRLTPASLVKAEWTHTHTGVASSFVDATSGSDSGDKRINVFSLSYSFTF